MKPLALFATILALAAPPLLAQATWGVPMQRGIAAVSCAAPTADKFGTPIPMTSAYTFGLFDLRNPASADYGPCDYVFPPTPMTTPLWDAPAYHHPTWNVQDLGNVFGITIDGAGDIYVGAHGLYGRYKDYYHRYGNIGGGAANLAAAGTVYRISGTTGVVTVFCVIPGQQAMPLATDWSGTPALISGPGLGNLTWDRDNNQFFVTSLEDGKIYRVSSSGTVINSFDPLVADTGAVGMPPRTDRLWAVEYENGAVFYSVWNNGDAGSPSVIRRVALLPSGDFDVPSDALAVTVPPQSAVQSTSPVADITFTLDGQKMIAGVRTMTNDVTAYNHSSGTHVIDLVAGVWTPVKFQRTGCNAVDGEAYGGVALGEEGGVQDSIVWASSADTAANNGPHGLAGVRLTDVPVNAQPVNSWKVPYVPGFTNGWQEDRKGSGGDVEIMRQRDDCADVVVKDIRCPEVVGGAYTLDVEITHQVAGTNVQYLQLKPCPAASLPPGAVTVQPLPSLIQTLTPPLPPGIPRTMTITLPGLPASGGMVYFNVKLMNGNGAQCCLEKVCVDLPACDCAELISTVITCAPDPATGLNKYTLTFTVRNQTNLSASPYSFLGATFLPPGGFDQSSIVLSPASIAPGAVGTVSVCYYGTPGPLCFNLALHDGTEENCCAIEKICITLPECDPAGDDPKPDTCGLEGKVACCPTPPSATVNFTICNNSVSPRTYNWNATSTASLACPIVLAAADFSPSSGVVGPVPPGGCVTVVVTINCSKLAGDRPCANFELCASFSAAVPPLCCRGIVYKPGPDGLLVKSGDPAGSAIAIPPGGTRTMTVHVENTGSTPRTTSLYFANELGILDIANSGGVRLGSSPIPVTVPPNSTVLVPVLVSRRDNGDAKGWTSVSVFTGGSDSVLEVPVLLLEGNPGGAAPRMRAIAIVEIPNPIVELKVTTMPGRFYQVQESPDLGPLWLNTTCVVNSGGVQANGIFEGIGGVMTCRVPCDATAPRMFYRIVRID